MKDFYFVDRSWHLLGTATAGGGGKIHIVDDTDDQLISAGARTYSGTILFTPELSSKVQTMAARGNYILYMDERNKSVFMTIMESSHDPLAGEETFTAEDAGIDLINETVGPYKAPQAMGIADYIKLFTNDSGFEIGLNEIPDLKRTLEWTGESDTTLNRILSVATQFDNAELGFSFDVSGTTVVRRLINIHKRIGADRNITLYVDKDINKIVTSGSIYDLYTAVTPTGGTPESKDGETTDQQPITLEGYQWTDPDGRYVLTKEGVLLDPVANQTWSRLLAKGGAPSVNAAYINRVVTYTATSQATLLQSALSDLKAHNHEAVNYETDIAVLPQNINIGDTIHLADEDEHLYLSARLLELKSSYSMDTHTATLGDYLIEHDQVAAQYRQLAEQIKNIPKTIQYYPWLRYADDDKGTNMSALPAGKKYMAVVYSNKSSVPSDNLADYAGKWALIKGADGADGVPGAKGADGRTSYFHTAWANDVSGQSGFTVSGGDGKKYIGTYSDFTQVDSTNPSDYNWALFKGEDGADGVAGKDGVGLKSTVVTYQLGSSGTTNPTGTWSATVPTLTKGQYLWTKTTWTYSDNTAEDGFSVAYIAKDGSSGADGLPGKDGVGIKSTVIEYAVSSNGVTKPSTGWSTTIPSVAAGQFMWTRTTWSYTDGTNEVGYSVAQAGATGPKGDTGAQGLQGLQGPKGDQGIKGPAGADGKSSYTHIAYGTSNSGAGFTQTPSTSTTYIGMYVDQTATDSNDPTKYAWSLIKGADGAQGAPGKAGADGKTPYFHIAYADSSDGKTNFSLDTPGSRKYIGSYTDFTQADSTNPALYSWQLVQGPKGDTGPQGPQGPQGVQGTPGSKDVPFPYVQLDAPANPKKGDTWWHGTSLKDATAVQRYDGSKWVDDAIAQAVLYIKELNSIILNSAEINSPNINVPFQHVRIAGSGILSSGSLTLNGASYVISGNIEDTNGKPNGQIYHTEVNPDGLLSYITQTDGTTQMHTSRISMGVLELTDLVDGLGNSAKYITSNFNAHDAVDYYHVDAGLETDNAKNINITYSRHGNLVNVGFDFDMKDNSAWKKLADIRPGYKPFGKIWAQVIGNTDVRGAVAVVYAQSGGWYMFPSLGNTNNYHGTFTFTTQDDYPTDDVVIK